MGASALVQAEPCPLGVAGGLAGRGSDHLPDLQSIRPVVILMLLTGTLLGMDGSGKECGGASWMSVLMWR